MAMRPTRGGGAGPNRPGRTTTVRPVYETFTPVFQRQQHEEAEKLLIYLPGFLKENIKVSTEGKTTLKVRGERLIGINKWNRFVEEFQVPEGCNMAGIHARFENGILTITMPIIPKKIPLPPATVTTQQEETTLQKPYIPPFLRTKDDHPPPLLAPQTTPDETQKQPPKVDFPPKISQPSLKGDEDSQKETTLPPPPPPPKEAFHQQKQPLNASDDGEDFPEKTSQFSYEKHMEVPKAPKTTHADYQDDDDFASTYNKSLPHSSVESQKKPAAALGPMFPKDYQDESPPPPPPPPPSALHGDQKSLEDEEKMKPLIGGGLVDEGEKSISSEVKAKGTIAQTLFDGRIKTTTAGVEQKKEQSVKQTSMKLGEAVKGGVTDPKEERQLLVNAGVAVLVILALGAYIYNTVGTRKSD